MQAKSPSPSRKAPKFLDTKILIAALSAAVTVGFWNLFAGQALPPKDTNANLQPDEGTSLQADDERTGGLPPIPTLVPLMDLSSADTSAAGTGAPAAAGSSAPLRAVAAPTVVVVQKNKPLIDSPAVTVVGGRSRGSGQQPAATTRSSR